jgi:hypothetical protein
MENAVVLKIPLNVKISVGLTWGSLRPIDKYFDDDKKICFDQINKKSTATNDDDDMNIINNNFNFINNKNNSKTIDSSSSCRIENKKKNNENENNRNVQHQKPLARDLFGRD